MAIDGESMRLAKESGERFPLYQARWMLRNVLKTVKRSFTFKRSTLKLSKLEEARCLMRTLFLSVIHFRKSENEIIGTLRLGRLSRFVRRIATVRKIIWLQWTFERETRSNRSKF